MEAIQQLTEITHSPDWTISELVELADEHGETYIRQEALRALGNMGEKSEEAVVDIQRIGAKFNDGLETKETAQVSAEVVEKIWRAIDKKKVAVGYQKLTSPCFATRAEGVEVWTEVALRRPKWSGVQRLVDLLFRPNDDEWQYLQTHPEMRTAITDALGRFGEHQKYRAAYDALVKVTENENEELMVRLQALDGVVRIRGLHPFDNLPLPDKLPPVPTTTSAPAAVVPTRPARPAPQPLVVPAPRPQVTPAPAPQIAPVPAPQVTPAPAPEVTPAPEPKVSKPPKPTEPPKPTPEAPKQEAKGVKVPADKPRPRPEEAKPEPEPEPEPEPKPKPKPTEEPPVVSGPEPVPAERTEEPAKKTGEEDKEEPVGKSVVPTQAKIGPIPVSTIVICACIILAIALVVLISWPFIKYIYSRWRVWRKKGRGPAPKPPAKKKAPPKSSTPTKPSAPSAKVK